MDVEPNDEFDLDDDLDMDVVEHEDIVEVRSMGRRAVSSGEPSLDGSIDVDEERGAVSDSDITHAARSNTIAAQVKGPSSDALEESCRLESAGRDRGSEWEDVLGSGQLLKKILIPGKGHDHDRPRDGQFITIKVIDTLRGVDSHQHFKFITGYSMVIDAWELVVKLMYVGETSAIRVKARLAYGDNGLDNTIPPNQDQEYTIELVEINESPKFTTMNEQDLSDFVLMLKDRGNFYFSRKEYEKAIFVYKRATGIMEVPEDSDPLRKLFSALHSNLAVCYSKLGDYDTVLACTEESLRLHSSNTKAMFRRAMALSSRKEFDEAADCLRTALEIEPNDLVRTSVKNEVQVENVPNQVQATIMSPDAALFKNGYVDAIQTELERLTGLRRRRRQDERQLYKKMLAGAGDSSSGSFSTTGWLGANWFRATAAVFCVVMFVFFLYFLSQM